MSQAPMKNNGDDELFWMILGALLLVVGGWFIGHEKISAFVMKVRAFEAYLLIFDRDAQDAIREWIATTHPKDASLKGLWESGMAAGRSLRYAVFVIVTGLFAYLVIRSPDRSARYTQTYTTSSLASQESDQWPVIKSVLGIGIEKKSLDDPINGMRARPRDYGRKHGFIVRISSLGDQVNSTNVEILDDKDALLLDRARLIFSKQLGKMWQGVNMLRVHDRCLFAACAAQINNDNDLSQDIINDLARAFIRARKEKNIKKIVSANADLALNKYGNTKAVQKIVSKHAYERTVLVSMLSHARNNGVLPPNWFRWLKTVDRVTWYALSDLGLDVASVESAGIRNHWLAETMSAAPIVNPMVESAVNGLKFYLGDIADEEVDE